MYALIALIHYIVYMYSWLTGYKASAFSLSELLIIANTFMILHYVSKNKG